MNEQLINNYNRPSYPTAVQTSLNATSNMACFDPTGRYVAAGSLDGLVRVWDLETREVVRDLDAHVRTITALDWSRRSRYLLTASQDWNVALWDLENVQEPMQRVMTFRHDAPVLSAQFHPRNSKIILVAIPGDVYIYDLRRDHEYCSFVAYISEEDVNCRATCARFDPSGRHIFVGTSNGQVHVYNTRTKMLVARHRIAGITGQIKVTDIEFTKSGRRFVTNTTDRTLRQFVTPSYPRPDPDGEILEHDLDPTHRFSDPINKTQWYAVSYSPDGEWLAGGAADPAAHKIYVWDLSSDGQLATALDGGTETLLWCHWNPARSMLLSNTSQGNILIWHAPTQERWGAFAGDFEELDENIMYEEREDEFDIEDESEIVKRKMLQEEEEVDIDTIDVAPKWEVQPLPRAPPNDEDLHWADEEPDSDSTEWALHARVLKEKSKVDDRYDDER
ncbi:WD40-repeat-containing domain protein [Schizophyllum amplum]|uniref:WD40-repeat-containing domain protein n=1 Tax=Schizophyllum amplum TaxID=97359 RepID=A0A550CUU1_9AGAR|nr:WD40-repeat-containing domain protein [Auriculariopsis ampla]